MWKPLAAIIWVITCLVQEAVAVESNTDFAFDFHEGLIWIEVKTGASVEPLTFLLDTGASVSVLDLQALKRLGLPKGERVRVCGVGSETEGYWPQHLSVQIGNLALPVNYLAVDLNGLGNACHRHLDGLLGADFFKGRVIQIDYAARTIRVLPKGSLPQYGEVFPLQIRHGVMRVAVRVNGNPPQWVRLDTGCVSALQWVAPSPQLTPRASRVSIGLAQINIPVIAAKVQLGSECFDSVPIGLHQQEIFHGEAGLLGNGLLSQFRVTIDVIGNRLNLQKYPFVAP